MLETLVDNKPKGIEQKLYNELGTVYGTGSFEMYTTDILLKKVQRKMAKEIGSGLRILPTWTDDTFVLKDTTMEDHGLNQVYVHHDRGNGRTKIDNPISPPQNLPASWGYNFQTDEYEEIDIMGHKIKIKKR